MSFLCVEQSLVKTKPCLLLKNVWLQQFGACLIPSPQGWPELFVTLVALEGLRGLLLTGLCFSLAGPHWCSCQGHSRKRTWGSRKGCSNRGSSLLLGPPPRPPSPHSPLPLANCWELTPSHAQCPRPMGILAALPQTVAWGLSCMGLPSSLCVFQGLLGYQRGSNG